MLENSAMQSGAQIPVLSGEMHGEHLRNHAPMLQQIISGVETGEVDPVQSLPLAEVLHAHCSEHTGFLSQNPMAKADAAGYRQMLQQSGEIIVNTRKKVTAMQRKAEEAQMAGGPGAEESGGAPAAEGPSAAQLKMEEHQQKLQINQQKADMDMQIRQSKAQQDIALKDATNAMRM
jgi:hypothetical protein